MYRSCGSHEVMCISPLRCTLLNLRPVNLSYTKLFRTHTLYQGAGGSPGPPTIASTLDCINFIFCKVLDIPFKVSENTRFVKYLLYGYHDNCLITWCFSLIIVKMSMKNRYFSNAPRNHKLEGIKIKLCVVIVLFLYFLKSNFKVGGRTRFVGGTGGK